MSYITNFIFTKTFDIWYRINPHRLENFSQWKSVNCLFARSPPCTKVRKKTSLSRYYTLCFCLKQYNFHLLIYSQAPGVRHFINWWHLSHFLWTTAFTRTFAIPILWCYNFNGMIKWYDISCAILYIHTYITLNVKSVILQNTYLFSTMTKLGWQSEHSQSIPNSCVSIFYTLTETCRHLILN